MICFCFAHPHYLLFSENIDLDNIGFVGNKRDELRVDQKNLKKKKDRKRKKQSNIKTAKKPKNRI